jgi:diaminohydroxyphosphoribosylaminopyrimidine deaminase/5-amino-6-(5-phosphoribosylamino)uracil reductase
MLAEAQLGQVWPNPSVGAVLVSGEQIIAEGATAKGGRPHAETIALSAAGSLAKGATLYVTLEPCAHHGQTPPCVDAIIVAGIAKVVIACTDPDPRTSGKSIEKLRAAGIEVEVGMGEAATKKINSGFFNRVEKNRPHVMLKLATSLDGKIALSGGLSRWITGAASRERVHQLRSTYDAVLTSINTVTADDPLLTCRLIGLEQRSPLRVVLDRRLEISPNCKLVKTAREFPVWVIGGMQADAARKATLEASGVRVIESETHLSDIMQLLGNEGLTRVMVEAGGTLAASLIMAKVVDEIYWFRAPKLIGGDGIDVIAGLGNATLEGIPHWRRVSSEHLDEDVLEVFAR